MIVTREYDKSGDTYYSARQRMITGAMAIAEDSTRLGAMKSLFTIMVDSEARRQRSNKNGNS